MKTILKNAAVLFQVLFYSASALSVIAFVFWVFTDLKFRTVGLLVLTAILFLLTYFLLYRLYTTIYHINDLKTLPEILDEIEEDKTP